MEHKTLLIIGIVLVMLASLACYIIGWIKLRKDQIVLVADGWDVTLILVSSACLFISYMSRMDRSEFLGFLIVGSVVFLGSAIFSVINNKGSFWRIVVSIMAKLFMVFISIFAIFVIAITSFVISIIALVSRDYELFRILNFKWLFKIIMGYY